MAVIQKSRLKNKKDTKENWLLNDPVLLNGEIGVEFNEGLNKFFIKIGDGVKKYSELNYSNGIVSTRWNGTILEVMDETGEYISANLIGPIPNHIWDDTKISFENPDGTYGEEKELMPSHEWNLSPNKKKLRFQNPEGGYGDEIDLSSYNYFFTEDKIGEVKEWIWTNCPENFLKLDGSTLQKTDNEEFFEFLIAEGEILDTDTEYTLPIQANKIIRVKSSLNAIYKIVDSVPVGVINALATETIPEGWLECNGAELSRETFSELFSKIGTRYGQGNGSTTFNLPDLRGEFIRGWDNGRGVDSGRTLGSYQEDAIRNITGSIFKISETWNTSGHTTGAFTKLLGHSGVNTPSSTDSSNSGGFTFDASRVVPTANENRPRNIALKYIIKYKIGDGRLS